MSSDPSGRPEAGSLLAELRAVENALEVLPAAPPVERALLHRDAVYLALDTGDTVSAMFHALSCLELARSVGDGSLQVKAHVAMALVQAESYDDLGADAQFTAADQLARRWADDRGVALVAVNASHYEIERRNYAQAVKRLTRLLASRHARGLDLPESASLLDTFHINFVVGASEALLAGQIPDDPGEVRRQLDVSVALLSRLEAQRSGQTPPLEATAVLDALTRHTLWLGDRDRAQRLADEHVRLAALADSPLLHGRALLDRSRVWVSTGQWEEAIRDALLALEQLELTSDGLWEGRAREALADAYAGAGRFQEAFATQQAVTRGMERLYRDYHQQRALVGQIEQQAREAEVRARALAEAALRDPLTGAPNRTRAMQVLAQVQARAARGQPSAVALLDLDHFKRVNDTYGHLAGDAVLIEVTRLLSGELRDQDLLARLGGEEFLVIVTDVEVDEALAVCERLRTVLSQATWDAVAPGLQTSGSFGVAALDGQLDITGVLNAADQALYAAKAAGRNSVQRAPQLPTDDG